MKAKKAISDKKLRGEWAEMCFMARAAEHGLQINKPWGEMSPYDFVVGQKHHLVRVQVKSTTIRQGTGFVCHVRGGHRIYAPGVFDFLAAYIVPEDIWYVIPAKLFEGHGEVSLYPDLPKTKYAPYKEAWHLLREATGVKEEETRETTTSPMHKAFAHMSREMMKIGERQRAHFERMHGVREE